MAYTLDESYSSPNYTTPEQMPYVGTGEPRIIDNCTYHHWNTPGMGDTIDSTTRTLCTPGIGKSAHAIIKAGLVRTIISADNAAWSCGNWHGNATAYSMELDPSESDEVYETAAEFTADLWKLVGGIIPLKYPHNHWTSTSCPGTYDLDRIHNRALEYYNGTTETKTVTVEDIMAALEDPNAMTDINGQPTSVANQLRSIDNKISILTGLTQGILAVKIPDPDDNAKSYTIADYIVWAATNAKHAAGQSAVAVTNTEPSAIIAAVKAAGK